MAKNVQDTGQASNRILVGTSIEGDIVSDGDIRIDGRVKGTIKIDGKLVIGEKGLVEGEVKSSYANISGQLKGKAQITELLTLQATAKVNGDVIAAKLAVEPGAEFTGSCNMGTVVREMKEGNGQEKREKDRQEQKQKEKSAG